MFISLSCKQQAEEAQAEEAKAHGEVTFTAEQFARAGIVFGAAEEKLLSSDIPARGKLVLPPGRHAFATSIGKGVLQRILVTPGSRVSKGQALAYVYDPDMVVLQQEFLRTRARLAYLEKDFERQSKLRDRDANAMKTLEMAEADLLVARADHASFKARLLQAGLQAEGLNESNLQQEVAVRAPITGKIETIMASIGQHLDCQQPVFELVNTDLLYIELSIFEKDISPVKAGQRVTFELINLAGGEYEATLMSVGSVVHEQSRVVTALAEFNNAPGLLPGMFAATRIHAGEQRMLALPETAVMVHGEEDQFIFISSDPDGLVFKKIAVRTGFREEGWVQVTFEEPVPEGARVVTEGAYYIWAEMEKQTGE